MGMEITLMKYILLSLFLVNFVISFGSNANSAIERSIYLECESCYTTSDFVTFGKNDFNNNYSQNINQQYAYTIVNHSAQLAVFLNLKHLFREEPWPDSHLSLDVIIPNLLTTDSEMNADYFLSRFVIKSNGSSTSNFTESEAGTSNYVERNSSSNSSDPEIVEITIPGRIGPYADITMAQYRGQISAALKSNVGGGGNWAKLAGRAIVIINFDNGKLGAFFSSMYATTMYQYLSGTAVDHNGNPIKISGGAPSSGGTGGLTVSGSGGWSVISGGGVVCTGIHGGSQVCRWIRF